MHEGIVSLLDSEHFKVVLGLSKELKLRFGVAGEHTTPYPHISYHVADRYDRYPLEMVVQQVITVARPFKVSTSGLGLFTGTEPVLYLAVVCSAHLADFQQMIWSKVNKACNGPVDHYSEGNWVPHITLADGPRLRAALPEVIRFLNEFDLRWQIILDNLALMTGPAEEKRIEFKRTFKSKE